MKYLRFILLTLFLEVSSRCFGEDLPIPELRYSDLRVPFPGEELFGWKWPKFHLKNQDNLVKKCEYDFENYYNKAFCRELHIAQMKGGLRLVMVVKNPNKQVAYLRFESNDKSIDDFYIIYAINIDDESIIFHGQF